MKFIGPIIENTDAFIIHEIFNQKENSIVYIGKDEREIINLGIFENFSEQIILVEWPELIKLDNSKKRIDLYFEYNDNLNERFLTISSNKNISFINELK